MKKVAILQREIPHYRVRFFEEVSAQAFAMGLDVTVYSSGEEFSENTPKFARRNLSIHRFTRNKKGPFWMKGLTAALNGTDIIVAPQELQCVNVPYLWAIRHRLCTSWIWWGHGYNSQASVRPSISTIIKESVKRFMTRRTDGVITYTASGAVYWRQQGLSEDHVIPYYNTLDVKELRMARAEISEQQLIELSNKFTLKGKRVLIFSGRLYAGKRVDFLLKAFAILKRTYPGVVLLIIGDGEKRCELEQLAGELKLTNVHFLGELLDPKDTAAYFSLADLMVIPAMVGLAIVHGFAFGLPLITTDAPGHGPEIEYLTPENGVLTLQNEQLYSDEILTLLNSPAKLTAMRKNAEDQSIRLHLDRSAARFLSAITHFSKPQLIKHAIRSCLKH
ncbi:MAG: glycosyltransferase family 4 protein [Nitrospira sp.]|nr:glycosyltransferase family 4 protein [Nitrospira sp.]